MVPTRVPVVTCGCAQPVLQLWVSLSPGRAGPCCGPGPRLTPCGAAGQRSAPAGRGREALAGWEPVGGQGQEGRETAPLGNGALRLALREPLVQAGAERGAGAMAQLRFLLQTGVRP